MLDVVAAAIGGGVEGWDLHPEHFAFHAPSPRWTVRSNRAAGLCSLLARDCFSLTHFPVLCGIVAYAAAVEEILAHPADPLPLDVRITLASGLTLFVGGMAVADPAGGPPLAGRRRSPPFSHTRVDRIVHGIIVVRRNPPPIDSPLHLRDANTLQRTGITPGRDSGSPLGSAPARSGGALRAGPERAPKRGSFGASTQR